MGYANESAFDRFVAKRGLSEEEIEAFIAFISLTYRGPLYTRTTDEVRDFYRAWRRSL